MDGPQLTMVMTSHGGDALPSLQLPQNSWVRLGRTQRPPFDAAHETMSAAAVAAKKYASQPDCRPTRALSRTCADIRLFCDRREHMRRKEIPLLSDFWAFLRLLLALPLSRHRSGRVLDHHRRYESFGYGLARTGSRCDSCNSRCTSLCPAGNFPNF